MLIVNLIGLVVIALIVWWFWLYKGKTQAAAADELVIQVANGSYQPSQIAVPAGQATTLRFFRSDESPCAAWLIFPDLDLSEELPIGESKSVLLPPLAAGNYPFSCQMQMYRGNLVVSES